MAQITPPDYSKIATRQQVYNVRPAQEQYRGPDENAGQVDLSTAKIIDSVVNGLDVFTRIYAQSEETADTLQANEILVKQANYNQSVKEAIKFNVGKTAPENLRMEGAVQKLRTINKDGKSDLYLGEGEGVNISSFPIPDDINDNVRSKIESSIVRGNIDIVNFLIDQVEDTQSKQIEGLLDSSIETFSQNYTNDTRNNSDKKTRRELLNNHLDGLFAEIDNLGYLGTYNTNQIRKQKEKVIQVALKAEFKSDLKMEGNYKTAIDNADKGEYKYKMDDGREISLSRAIITPYVDQQISEQRKSSNNFKDYLSKTEKITYINRLSKDAQDSPSTYLLKYGLSENGKFRITNEKIDNDPALNQYTKTELKELGPDADGNPRIATIDQQRSIKKALLHKLYQQAIKDHEAEVKAQEGNIYVPANFNRSYIPTVVNELQVHLKERVLAAREGKIANKKEIRRTPLKDKKLNSQQLAEVKTLEFHAEKITVIAEEVNNWKLSELKDKIKYLEGLAGEDDNFSGLSEIAQNILQGRIKDLSENIAYIQLKESSLHNERILDGGDGQYKMEDVRDWQKAHGITNKNRIVPQALLAEIKTLEDPLLDIPQKMAIMDKFVALKYKYGKSGSMATREISLNMRSQIDGGMRGVFSVWENQNPIEREEYLRGQITDFAKAK
jgi:hypothetical protein